MKNFFRWQFGVWKKSSYLFFFLVWRLFSNSKLSTERILQIVVQKNPLTIKSIKQKENQYAQTNTRMLRLSELILPFSYSHAQTATHMLQLAVLQLKMAGCACYDSALCVTIARIKSFKKLISKENRKIDTKYAKK